MRAKFDEDLVKKLAEPRYCFKYLNGRKSGGFKVQTKDATNIDDSHAKKMVVDNNFNFLFDLVEHLINPQDAILVNSEPEKSLEENILIK